MEFTTKTIKQRWAPTIEVSATRSHRYLNKADLYNAVFNRVMELGQDYDTWFKVVVQSSSEFSVDIFYGFLDAEIHMRNKLYQVDNNGFIPKTAHNIATKVVELVYGGE